MQGDDADAAAEGFGESELDEVAGQMAAAIFRLDVDVQEVAAGIVSRIEGMRRPVEEEEAGSGDYFAVVFGEPAEVAAVGDGLRDPRLVRLGHELENLIVAAAGIDKHAAAMMRDERSVGGESLPRLQHDEQYRAYDEDVTRASSTDRIRFDRTRLSAGLRVAVAVSGGADSVGLLRAMIEAAPEIGLVLAVAHVHHGIRGAEADEDARFVEDLAKGVGLEYWACQVDTPGAAREKRQTLEEAARELRYAWFRELMAQGRVDAVATAHTLDDQAETVLHRLLRGAWTEGLGGIHPVVRCDLVPERSVILRPFLATRREAIRAWLREIGQPWREDESNLDLAHTRNRIRHELMPRLEALNPRIAEQLAHMATIARDEESWWDAELARSLPGLVLPGKPVRGGGRAVPTHPDQGSVGMELERLRALAPAMRRRVLREAARQLRCRLNFEQTERLMVMCVAERESGGAKKQELTAELRAEKSARELRLVRQSASADDGSVTPVEVQIPGETAGLGVRLRLSPMPGANASGFEKAVLRAPKAGDRVQLRHSRGAKPLKEIFERMQVEAEARKTWPVLEWQGRIVWMKGVAVEVDGVPFRVEEREGGD